MIYYKTSQEIDIMGKGGKILADVLSSVLEHIQPGVSELEIDFLAERLIKEKGGEPGFKKVPGYSHTICVSTNEVVVHGIPTEYRFKKGDVVGIDCGVYLDGFHTDMSETIVVGGATEASSKVQKFLQIGKKALEAGITQAMLGNRVGSISQAIQKVVEGGGYSVVRSLIGHGVGRQLHEEPEVPGFLHGAISQTPLLKEGMTIAVEVIYNMGAPEVSYARGDSWTIKTKDNSLSGLFERTVVITRQGPRVLTV